MTNEAFEKTLYDLKHTFSQTLLTPTNKAGWPFIIVFAIISIILAMLSGVLGFVGLILTLWCVYFFRDPVRMVPQGSDLVVSPADGRVTSVDEHVTLPRELRATPDLIPLTSDSANLTAGNEDGNFTRVSIFLSVFDVHVNRVPVSGTVKKLAYRPGLFLNAGSERASIENERSAVLVETTSGIDIGFVQVAGLIARRIINELREGDAVTGGHRYGLIRFGSRMDIYVPSHVAIKVSVGQRVLGGETILADLSQTGPSVITTPI